jgi:hypothetical protein
MTEIFSEHKQSAGEIRRLALVCHGLDLTSTNLSDGTSEFQIGDSTREVLHEQISCNLLALAIALRVNFYQTKLISIATCDVRHHAGMYWNDELVLTKTTIKDVCDKIIHADVFKKTVLPNKITSGAYATIQMQGSQGKRKWTLNLCVALFCESVLSLLEEAENVA